MYIGQKLVLFRREKASMASSWEDLLCLVKESDDFWSVGIYNYEWIASIYQIPQSERYDEDGELVIPAYWKGKRIVCLADGEYLQTDTLILRDDKQVFTARTLNLAEQYCKTTKWDQHHLFKKAFVNLKKVVQGKIKELPAEVRKKPKPVRNHSPTKAEKEKQRRLEALSILRVTGISKKAIWRGIYRDVYLVETTEGPARLVAPIESGFMKIEPEIENHNICSGYIKLPPEIEQMLDSVKPLER